MTPEELEETIRKLREFAVAQGMQWVLDEVDEAIALGVPETRTHGDPGAPGSRRYQLCRSQLVPIGNTGVRCPGESAATSAFSSGGK